MLQDIRVALTFLTRIPVPAGTNSGVQGSLAKAMWAFPLVGCVVGAAGGIIFVAVSALSLPGVVAAIAAVAAMIGVTGALHEDGLADMADGAGGATRPQKLEIMKDSRIGTYGVIALLVIILLKVALVSAYADQSGASAIISMFVVAGAASRAMIVASSYALRTARTGGLSSFAGRPSGAAVFIALALAALIGFSILPSYGAILGIVGALFGGIAVMLIARRIFSGQTGDVLGATQQIAEVGVYFGVLVAVS
jgi:adenosylcobinamide-GDP ribazoletransferase